MSTIYIGVDIAKHTFEAEAIDATKRVLWRRAYPNQEAGYARLWRDITRTHAGHVHVCMEATSVLWEGLAYYLHARQVTVQVVNPARIKHYARAEGLRQKTDRLDAGVIARFSLTQACRPWVPPAPELRTLQALVRRMDDITRQLQQERNRVASAVQPLTAASIARMIAALTAEYAELERSFNDVLQRAPQLAHDLALLCTIAGVHVRTARQLLVFLRATPYETARQAAAAAGVTPMHASSGMKRDQHPRISRMGCASLRQALFTPAMVAARFNPLLKPWAAELHHRGKALKQVRCAVMRRLIHIAFGVLKHQTPFSAHVAA